MLAGLKRRSTESGGGVKELKARRRKRKGGLGPKQLQKLAKAGGAEEEEQCD
jgi:hypothetical protein